MAHGRRYEDAGKAFELFVAAVADAAESSRRVEAILFFIHSRSSFSRRRS